MNACVERTVVIAAALSAFSCLGCKLGDERNTLTVLAASSLTDAFADLEAAFERAHPDVDVVISTAGSQVLRVQIEQGVRADLFASAHPRHMRELDERDAIRAQSVFAHGRLTIAVPRDNPAGIHQVADLTRARRLVIGASSVPVGQYTEAFLDAAEIELGADFADRVRARVVSRELNVRLVRAKVAMGEADAAIVYATDTNAREVTAIAIPPALSPVVSYRIAQLADAPEPEWARQFSAFLTSETGRAILRKHGFASVDNPADP